MTKTSLPGLALLLVLAISSVACDGFTTVKGHVRDSKGLAIDGAKVILKTEKTTYREDTTEKDGSYSIFTSNAPFKFKMKLIITKQGYKTYEKDFDSNSTYEHDVTLEPN